ncbi:MAG: hypothetical protein MZV70_50230 [Desulfobacterales bacterium]|nr:hypothetical protein [Desulfobacterales bacterium]
MKARIEGDPRLPLEAKREIAYYQRPVGGDRDLPAHPRHRAHHHLLASARWSAP